MRNGSVGELAFFSPSQLTFTSDSQGVAFGVADGVGGWVDSHLLDGCE